MKLLAIVIATVVAAVVFAGNAALADSVSAPMAAAPPAGVQTPASPAAPAAAPVAAATGNQMAAENNNDTICQMVAPTTGTRFGAGRECHTRKWWATRQHEAEQITDHHEMGNWVPPGSGK